MGDQEVRLLQIEGQIHALSRAWLYLAAQVEIQELADPEVLERSMLSTNWQGAPFEQHAHGMMQSLIADLSDARERRLQIDPYQSTGRDE